MIVYRKGGSDRGSTSSAAYSRVVWLVTWCILPRHPRQRLDFYSIARSCSLNSCCTGEVDHTFVPTGPVFNDGIPRIRELNDVEVQGNR